jgi:hypothetical protein
MNKSGSMWEVDEKNWSKNIKGRLSVDRMIILKWISKKQGVRGWNGFSCLRIRASGGLCEDDNFIFGFHKSGNS